MVWFYIASLVLGYLLGSINSSVIFGKIIGVDVRKVGSGNAGATNALRTMGKKAGIIVVIGDVLKTILAMILVRIFTPILFPGQTEVERYAEYLAGFAAVVGHNYPIYFGFRGGKGIICSISVIFMLDWRIGLITLFAGVIVIACTRFVSLGSLTGAVMFPTLVIIFSVFEPGVHVPYYITLAVVMMVLAFYQHRANIKRLISGTESKLGEKK